MKRNHTLRIKNIELGAGLPKICVSVTGKKIDDILKQVEEMKKNPVDIVEWRLDFYEGVLDAKNVLAALEQLHAKLDELPLLVTFRQKKEGGEKELSLEEYKSLNRSVIESGLADMIDVELFSGDELVRELIGIAHENGVKVLLSNHDFEKTPKKEELLERMQNMQKLGADVSKIAVMPQSEKDVLVVLCAMEEFKRSYADRPFLLISMSKLGLITRLAGGVFGSAMTFGAVGQVSAPGQLEVCKMKDILEILERMN